MNARPDTVNSYIVPQGHKARIWIIPQGPISVITCRIDQKLGGNVSPDLIDKMHLDLFQKMSLGHNPSTRLYGKS